MPVPQRYDEFDKIDNLSLAALSNRGKAADFGFITTREGVLLRKGIETPNQRPDLTNGLPMMKPEFRDPYDLEMNPPKPGSRFPKPRPPGL